MYYLTHDMKRDIIDSNTLIELKERSIKSYENRCFHHHVFDIELTRKMFKFSNINFINSEFLRPCNLITIGQKTD